jgi:putative tricarboxylic transport membrane protein
MIIDAFVTALHAFADPWLLLFMSLGVVVGLIIGILPGIGPIQGLALFLPFAFYLPADHALPYMVGLASVSATGGSITTVLLNVPGDSVNAATLLDGFPMSQKGEAGRALGAALTSSGTGGIISVIMALLLIPVIMRIVLSIQSADMAFIILVGIVFIAVLARGSTFKGLISGGLGLLFSLIGLQGMTGLPRLTFGVDYLFNGISLLPLAVGLFAIPEMISLAAGGGTIAKAGVTIKGVENVAEGIKDVFRHWTLWLRSSVIGFVVGIIPGIGGGVSTFTAYGQAKHTSKNPEKFGTGCVEGVIAPQSACNSVIGGALLTTLAVGIPGDASMAIFLGALIMMGLVPGPAMLSEHLDLSLTLLLIVVVGNFIGAGLCLLAAPVLARVALVPSRILFPVVTAVAFVSVFAYQGMLDDVIAALVFGILGLAMRNLGFNRPALFLGYILGGLFEQNLLIGIGTSGPLLFLRPIAIVAILIAISVLCLESIKKMFKHLFKRGLGRA